MPVAVQLPHDMPTDEPRSAEDEYLHRLPCYYAFKRPIDYLSQGLQGGRMGRAHSSYPSACSP
jgi:hypothetical protein